MPAVPSRVIVLAPLRGRLRVRFAGRVIADSRQALLLHEAGHAPVAYVPRDDVDMRLFVASGLVTYCPHKGEARHFSLALAGRCAENAAWSYEQPLPAVAAIAGHLAFYPDRVEAIDHAAE